MSFLKINDIVPDAATAPPVRCGACRDGTPLPFAFTMAFQPIVDIAAGKVWGYEALVRGTEGEGASFILDQVEPNLIYGFDQACRIRAVELAGALLPPGGELKLSINFMPNAVYEPNACIRATLAAAARVGFDPTNLMFEFTENERMRDVDHVRRIVASYRARGFTTAIDDFGAGYSGLGLLAQLSPDILKIDMALVRDIDQSATKRAIVAGIVAMARAIGVVVLAEGIETGGELATIRALGIDLCQGFLLGRPETGRLPIAMFGG